MATTDTLYLVDRKYVSICPEFVKYVGAEGIPLTNEEKELITEAYSKGTFVLYDEDGNIEYIPDADRDENLLPSVTRLIIMHIFFLPKREIFLINMENLAIRGIVLPFPVNGKRKWKRLLRSIVLIVFPRAKITGKHIKTEYFPSKERGL